MTPTLLDEIERGLEGVRNGPFRVGEGTHALLVFDAENMAVAGAVYSHPNPEQAKKSLAAHIARMDPQTVAELIRLARIGMDADAREQAAYERGMEDAAAIAEGPEYSRDGRGEVNLRGADKGNWSVPTKTFPRASDYGQGRADAAKDIRAMKERSP